MGPRLRGDDKPERLSATDDGPYPFPKLPPLLLRPEQIEVNDHSHREVTRAIGVQLVAGIPDRAVGNELRLQAAALVDGDSVEIGNTVEQAGVANEVIETLA